MSESTGPTDDAPQAEGMAKGEGPAHVFPDEDRTEGATEQEIADRREGPERTERDPLGPGGPGASVDPDTLR